MDLLRTNSASSPRQLRQLAMNQLSHVLLSACLAASATALQSADVSPARAAADLVREGDALMQQSRDALDPTRYPLAREAYERALALDPQRPGAMLGLAWVFNSEHQFAEGARWCDRALAVDENLPDAYALLSDGAVELGDYDRALDWCQRALDLRPDLASYSRAAHLLWLTGQPDRARALMTAAIAAGGSHAENTAWCEAQLALMLLHAGETDEAGRRVEVAIARAPRSPHLLLAASRSGQAVVRISVARAPGRAPTGRAARPATPPWAIGAYVDLGMDK